MWNSPSFASTRVLRGWESSHSTHADYPKHATLSNRLVTSNAWDNAVATIQRLAGAHLWRPNCSACANLDDLEPQAGSGKRGHEGRTQPPTFAAQASSRWSIPGMN